MLDIIRREFEHGTSIPLTLFPPNGMDVQDTPRLTLVALNPEVEWAGAGTVRNEIAEWTKQRGKSPRLYPGSLVWCVRKPGRELRDKVEMWLAWRRVAKEIADGTLGGEFERSDRTDIQSKMKDAEDAAKEEVWGTYRFVVLADNQEADGLKVIDLGAGHSSSGETLCGRVLTALKSQALLNETVGAGYIDRNWPPALKESGAWPLASLRQSFLNGSLTRLIDSDAILKRKILEFVEKGDFGLASGAKPDATYERVWFGEMISTEEVAFESGVFLLKKSKAQAHKAGEKTEGLLESQRLQLSMPLPVSPTTLQTEPLKQVERETTSRTLRLTGVIQPEVWNRLGTKIIPKLKSAVPAEKQASDLKIGLEFSVTLSHEAAENLEKELLQILDELGLRDKIMIQ
jgi:hypothetical protein